MESIRKNALRHGNFTSSEIEKLTSNGKASGSVGASFYTYINEKNMERRLGRSLTDEVDARPATWGKLVERFVFDLLPPDYTIMGDETIQHSEIEYWSGTPDVRKKRTCGDVKCPKTLKSFCQLVDPYLELRGDVYVEIHPAMTIEAVRANHKEGNTYYWQIVSNAILIEDQIGEVIDTGELIVYVPFQKELDDIRDLAQKCDGEELSTFSWIVFSNDEHLPYLKESSGYNNLNIISFPIPQADKDFLRERVLKAGKFLIS